MNLNINFITDILGIFCHERKCQTMRSEMPLCTRKISSGPLDISKALFTLILTFITLSITCKNRSRIQTIIINSSRISQSITVISLTGRHLKPPSEKIKESNKHLMQISSQIQPQMPVFCQDILTTEFENGDKCIFNQNTAL